MRVSFERRLSAWSNKTATTTTMKTTTKTVTTTTTTTTTTTKKKKKRRRADVESLLCSEGRGHRPDRDLATAPRANAHTHRAVRLHTCESGYVARPKVTEKNVFPWIYEPVTWIFAPFVQCRISDSSSHLNIPASNDSNGRRRRSQKKRSDTSWI